MSIWRLLGWAVVVLFALIPLSWIRLYASGSFPSTSTASETAVAWLGLWGVAALLAYVLIVTARSKKLQAATQQRHYLELIAQPLTPVQPRQALLKPGEVAYVSAQGDMHQLQTTGYAGGSSGVSVRVAKGLTLRSGSSRARAVKQLVKVSSGELVVTDRRVIFAGDAKSFVVALGDLVNTTTYSDGFGFSNGKTTYTVGVVDPRARILVASVLERVIRGQST